MTSNTLSEFSFKWLALPLLMSSLSLVSTLVTAQNIHLNDMRLKSDLDWLSAQGVIQISTSTWPLTTNQITSALEHSRVHTTDQQQMVQSVRSALIGQSSSKIGTKLSAYAQTDRTPLTQSFADDQTANLQATAQLGMTHENWEFNLQANIKDDDIIKDKDYSFDGSYVAGKYANQWIIAGQIPTWWGPGHDGSLIRGDASLPVTGVTLQRDIQSVPNSRYLSWIGPWQYQFSISQLDDYNAILKTKLIGTRLTASPTTWLNVGASRMIMWGGDDRSESISSFIDALSGKYDNTGDPNTDPTNSLAGFDARFNLAPLAKVPVGIYGQYVGEDEAGYLPSKNMFLAGIDYASSFNTADKGGMPYQLYTEWTDTSSSGDIRGISYNHYIYTDGYYQNGYPLGYALGGDAESITVGGKLWLDNQNFVSAKMQHAKVNQSNGTNNKAFPESDKLKVLDVTWEHQYNPQTAISTRIWAVDSENNSADFGAGIGVEWGNF